MRSSRVPRSQLWLLAMLDVILAELTLFAFLFTVNGGH